MAVIKLIIKKYKKNLQDFYELVQRLRRVKTELFNL